MTSHGIAPNLALDQLVARRRAKGESIVHLGFGEARLPVFPPLAQRLAAGAHRISYGPVAGDAATRAAVAGYFDRRNLPTDPEQIVVAPGSKPLLLALQLAIPGDVVLPRPAWNTYAPQARLAGKTVHEVPIPDDCGGVPEPEALLRTIREARAAGRDPRIVVLTLPDNPTGTVAPPEVITRIAAIAREEDLHIVSDEIYRDLVFDPATVVLSPAEVAPERTTVVTGLSKNLALGGWRIGTARFATSPEGERIREHVTALASEIWSSLPGPMQEVAAYAFAEPPEVVLRLAASARLHGTVTQAVYDSLVGVGVQCRRPTAGFYLYPDLQPVAETLRRRGITDSASLQQQLIDEFGIAVLSGAVLGDDPAALRFRIATSQLYGDTPEQQQLALEANDPLTLRHVAESLARIQESFTQLCR
ncbi:pyridoxal phosphate-dependent aminotransferase [Streptomyces sp. NBC_00299]|uniref:pyridoxal phosphate-dependent aminotransferase n=1 Tax=Streptomyces sp. NBC_00299 TaxID=2975705 RepID=UPI002E29A98B|nr:pyridoxal phosphate-dependent aminotransferase [Streptomyces sp. NBC_00299]